MKNMLVTGGCGFIGSNFIRHMLCSKDFDGRIVNADKLTYAGNPDNLSDLATNGRYFFEKADICDKLAMAGIFENHEIDTVCHFAAESHVDRSIVGPGDFVDTNIIGTFVLLELVRTHADKIVLFHHISTDEVYGSLGKNGLFTEETPYRPSSPYSASKASSDHFVRAYHKTYGIPVTLSNCSNNYGPYQFPEKLIPLTILNALGEKPIPVYGDGGNVRDWLYVTDHCDAIWTIMKNGKRGETYNIGGSCEKRNITVVETICDLLDEITPRKKTGPRRDLITFVKDRPGHDLRYAVDAGKINRELGWSPKESFETAIAKTIRWYLDHPGWIDRVKSGEYLAWMEKQYQ